LYLHRKIVFIEPIIKPLEDKIKKKRSGVNIPERFEISTYPPVILTKRSVCPDNQSK